MSAWPRPEPPAPAHRDRQAAEQALHVIAGGVVLFLLGAGGLAAAYVHHHSNHATPRAPGSIVVSAGPVRATPVARYLSEREPILAKANGHVTAIVSFKAYLPDDQVASVVRGVHRTRFLVAAPGGEPDATSDVKQWRTATMRQAAAEIPEFERVLPSLSQDPEFAAQSRADLERDKKIVAALQNDAPIVFGVVVDGDAGAMRALSKKHDVRFVDIAPDAAAGDIDVHGLRPEETVAAGDPPQRPT